MGILCRHKSSQYILQNMDRTPVWVKPNTHKIYLSTNTNTQIHKYINTNTQILSTKTNTTQCCRSPVWIEPCILHCWNLKHISPQAQIQIHKHKYKYKHKYTNTQTQICKYTNTNTNTYTNTNTAQCGLNPPYFTLTLHWWGSIWNTSWLSDSLHCVSFLPCVYTDFEGWWSLFHVHVKFKRKVLHLSLFQDHRP